MRFGSSGACCGYCTAPTIRRGGAAPTKVIAAHRVGASPSARPVVAIMPFRCCPHDSPRGPGSYRGDRSASRRSVAPGANDGGHNAISALLSRFAAVTLPPYTPSALHFIEHSRAKGTRKSSGLVRRPWRALVPSMLDRLRCALRRTGTQNRYITGTD